MLDGIRNECRTDMNTQGGDTCILFGICVPALPRIVNEVLPVQLMPNPPRGSRGDLPGGKPITCDYCIECSSCDWLVAHEATSRTPNGERVASALYIP